MQESIQAALTVVRSRAESLGIKPNFYEKYDVHIHVPEGAIPKDGPSAGGAMAISLISIFTGIPVRADTAMTGEITLRGQILKIGGLKEKLLAAKRGGIKNVIIPKDNEPDLQEVPEQITKSLNIIPVEWIDEVISSALTEEPIPSSKKVKIVNLIEPYPDKEALQLAKNFNLDISNDFEQAVKSTDFDLLVILRKIKKKNKANE